MRALAIDFETANEDRASACAVGLAWIENGVITRRAHRLIRPQRMYFNPWNTKIHGIRARDVKDSPAFGEVLSEFADDIARFPLIAHNAAFDIGVLSACAESYGMRLPPISYLCTVLVARRTWPGHRRYSLDQVAARLGVAFGHHHAGEDAFACASIAVAAAEEAGAEDIPSLAARLKLTPGRLAGDARSGCASQGAPAGPDRGVRPPRRQRAAEGGLPTFRVRGSTGNEYEVSLRRRDGGHVPRCTCMAGRTNRLCRHVTALLDGDVTNLLSPNADEVRPFCDMVAGGAALTASR